MSYMASPYDKDGDDVDEAENDDDDDEAENDDDDDDDGDDDDALMPLSWLAHVFVVVIFVLSVK